MPNIEKLLESTTLHEGFRHAPYQDNSAARRWTFAIGQCLETAPLDGAAWKFLLDGAHLSVSISEAGAKYLLRRSLDQAWNECQKGFSFFQRLNDARQNVLIEMCFQMGVLSLMGFTQMLRCIERGDFKEAAMHGLDSKWAKIDSPQRAKQLMNQLERGSFV